MRQRFRSFVSRNEGGVLIMTAFALPLCIMAIGCAIDYSRAAGLKGQLQNAADAAVLLAAKQAPSMNDKDLLAVTSKVFKANVADPTAKIDSLKVSNGRRKVELAASAVAKRSFMGAVGFSSLPISAFSTSVTADNAYEIALVIDNSGSMASSAGGKSKMQSAKDAANKLIDAMMGTQSASIKTKLSIVPFTLALNVGSQQANASWIDTGAKSSIHWENPVSTVPFGEGTPGGDSGGNGKGKSKGKNGKGKNKDASGGNNGGSTGGGWTPSSRFDVFASLGVSWAGFEEIARSIGGLRLTR
jgi:Flp pilus assembly protein TadG